MTCGWCDEESVTELIIVHGRKKRRTAPVCALHATRFEGEGQLTTRVEADNIARRLMEKATWAKGRFSR